MIWVERPAWLLGSFSSCADRVELKRALFRVDALLVGASRVFGGNA